MPGVGCNNLYVIYIQIVTALQPTTITIRILEGFIKIATNLT